MNMKNKSQTFYKSFPKTDKFVANMKKSFNQKRKMCRYFKNSIHKMPSKRVKTRWTSWLKTVKEHSINFEKYETLFETIKKDKIGKSSLNSIPYIMNLLKENKIEKYANLYSEFDKYKSLMIIEGNQQLNTMQFWSINKEETPLLSNDVINYMSIPISDAEVERSFSCLGNILTDKRRRLTTENLKYLLFLNYNSKHKFET